MEIEKRKPNLYDTAKGIGILLMVMGHSAVPQTIQDLIYGFHMPLFFVIAGMLYDAKRWENLGFVALCKRRWNSYVVPYFILSGINLVLNGINEIPTYPKFEKWLNAQVMHTGWIVFANGNGKETPYCTPLWFLPCLFLACLILYWILRYKRFGQVIACFFLFAINRGFRYIIPGSRTLPWHLDVACVGAVFMLIGYYIKEKGVTKYVKKWPVSILGLLTFGLWIDILCGGGVALFSNRIKYPLATFICSICMTVGIVGLSEMISNTIMGRFLSFCGRSTLIFMGFNYYFNGLLRIAWKLLPILNSVDYPKGMLRFSMVTGGLVIISLIWEWIHPYVRRIRCNFCKWVESL